MKFNKIFLLISLFLAPTFMLADDEYPSISPTATYVDKDGVTQTLNLFEEDSPSISGNAPLDVTFESGTDNPDGWTEYYEWRFTEVQKGSTEEDVEPYIIRYDESTQVTFKKAGTTNVVLYAIFTHGLDSVAYTKDFWTIQSPLSITISESKLEMPNAFSPNGDEYNPTYKPKTYQSLVEFKATIYNRWGQKLYEWTDPSADGWDGTFHGKDVAQGVYFCDVTATGADGTKYHFRKDVNLLRGFNENKDSNTDE